LVQLLSLNDGLLEVAEYLLELMNDKNKEVAKMSSKALDILAVSFRH